MTLTLLAAAAILTAKLVYERRRSPLPLKARAAPPALDQPPPPPPSPPAARSYKDSLGALCPGRPAPALSPSFWQAGQ